MPDREIEGLLARLPLREPDREADHRMLEAIARSAPRRSWWRRPVQLWQAAAATVVLACAAGTGGWALRGIDPVSREHSARGAATASPASSTELDSPTPVIIVANWFTKDAPRRTDGRLAEWGWLESNRTGDQSP